MFLVPSIVALVFGGGLGVFQDMVGSLLLLLGRFGLGEHGMHQVWVVKTNKTPNFLLFLLFHFENETVLYVFCPAFFICTVNFAFCLGFQCLSGRGRSTKTLHEGCHSGEGREPCGSDPRGTGRGQGGKSQEEVTEGRCDFAVLYLFPNVTLYLVNLRKIFLILRWGTLLGNPEH